MTPQAPERLLIAGNEFKLAVSLLPDYLTAYKIQLDDRKNYSAT